MKFREFTSLYHNKNLSYSQLVVIRGLTSRSGSSFHPSRFYSSSTGTSWTQEFSSDDKEENEHDLALFPDPSDLDKFVPKCEPIRNEDVKRLQEFVNHSKRLLIMTGEFLFWTPFDY